MTQAAVAPPELSALDIACGIAFQSRPSRRAPRLPAPDATAGDALERAVVPALRRPPCLVSFSGGRDSSLVLAAATRAARREGLDLPIPVTNRFPAAPNTDESGWQEAVIAHLGLPEWTRFEFTDELDALGPYARRLLGAHGLLWPFNVHFHLPLIDAARGGSLLTGAGGDELFGAAEQTRVGAVLDRAVRPGPRDVIRLGFSVAPRGVRRRVLMRRRPLDFPWLRPPARRAVAFAAATQEAAEPPTLAGRMAYWRDMRYLRVGVTSLAAAAAAADVQLVHPLLARPVWSAVHRAGAPQGFRDHGRALETLFAGWLPDALYDREDKASFNEIFWHEHSRAFIADWDGAGIPEALVDVAALREHWSADAPVVHSLTLLQAAWLNGHLDVRLGGGRVPDVSLGEQYTAPS